MSKKFSNKYCPDCKSKNFGELDWIPYGEKTFNCNECDRTWDKNTKYCKICKDVVMYCQCFEDMY